MKTKQKFLLITIAACICATTNLYAATANQNRSGLYLGFDAIHSFAEHSYLAADNASHQVTVNGHHSSGDATGFGASFGYKIALRKAFIAPEIFYDNLNNSAPDFSSVQFPARAGDNLEVNDRYGAKLNLGYNIYSKLNLFASAGISNIDYTVNLRSTNAVRSSTANYVPIFGGGVSYDLSSHWLVRASYDWQQFVIRYDFSHETDRITLQTARIGIAYKF